MCYFYFTVELAGPPYSHCWRRQGGYWSCKLGPKISSWHSWELEDICKHFSGWFVVYCSLDDQPLTKFIQRGLVQLVHYFCPLVGYTLPPVNSKRACITNITHSIFVKLINGSTVYGCVPDLQNISVLTCYILKDGLHTVYGNSYKIGCRKQFSNNIKSRLHVSP